jgi:fatty acid desaturase
MRNIEIPKVAIPTILVALLCFGCFFLNLALSWKGSYPLPFGVIISILCLYYAFTPLHEAAHGNILSGGHLGSKINTFLGMMSGFLLLAPFSIFKPLHLKHHSFVNRPDKDPDYWVKGKNPLLVLLKAMSIFFHYYYYFFTTTKDWKRSLLSVTAYNLFFALAGYGVIKFTSTEHFLFMWILPFFVTMTLLGLTFDYIPHHPHDDQTRYNNARTFPGMIRSILMANHNYHIIHHLYPRIPFYLYQKTYRKMDQKERDLHHRIYP